MQVDFTVLYRVFHEGMSLNTNYRGAIKVWMLHDISTGFATQALPPPLLHIAPHGLSVSVATRSLAISLQGPFLWDSSGMTDGNKDGEGENR